MSEERLKLDRRIHNQRVRLHWFENLFEKHTQAYMRWKRPYWLEYALKLSKENRELRRQIEERLRDTVGAENSSASLTHKTTEAP